jgi:hypothetical protein
VAGPRRIGDVDRGEAGVVGDKEIAELQCGRANALQRDHSFELRFQRIVEIDDDEARVGGDVGVMAAQHDVARAVEDAILVPRDRARHEVVLRVAVGQCVDVGENQTLDGVGERRIAVDRVERLLLIRHAHQVAFVARWRNRLVGRQRDTGRVGRRNMRILPRGRKRRGDDLLRHALVPDARDVLDAQACASFGDVQVLAAKLHATRRSRWRASRPSAAACLAPDAARTNRDRRSAADSCRSPPAALPTR